MVENNFEKKFPSFADGVGIRFEDLSLTTRTELAGEWLVRGMLDKVEESFSNIDPFSPVGAFKGLSWNEYLLTRKDELHNKMWKEMRHNLTDYKGHKGWGDSAALVAAVNNEDMFKEMLPNDWVGVVSPDKLKAAGVEISTSLPLSASDKIIYDADFLKEGSQYSSVSGREYRSAIEFAAYHGSKKGVEAYCSSFKDFTLTNPGVDLNRAVFGGAAENGFDFGCYLAATNRYIKSINLGSVDPLINLLTLRQEFDKVDSSRSSLSNPVRKIVRSVLINLDDANFYNVYSALPASAKKLFYSTSSQSWKDTKNSLIEKGKLDRVDLMNKVENDMGDHVHYKYYLSDLWDAIAKNKKPVVEYLLNKNPDWLNEKDWVYENRSSWRNNETKGSKKGNCLAYAAVKGSDEIALFLFEKGADVKSLVEVSNYEPFRKSESFAIFQPIAERIRLKQKIEVKKGVKLDITPLGSAL